MVTVANPSHSNNKNALSCIEDHSDDLLFLLDGLDKYKLEYLHPLISGQLLPNSKIIITSRQSRALSGFDKSTIAGLETAGRNTLVTRYLIALSDNAVNLIKGIKLLKYFCNSLKPEHKKLFKKPIMLQFMCVTYKHHVKTCYGYQGKADMGKVEEFLSELMRVLVLRGSQEMDVLRGEISSYIDNKLKP